MGDERGVLPPAAALSAGGDSRNSGEESSNEEESLSEESVIELSSDDEDAENDEENDEDSADDSSDIEIIEEIAFKPKENIDTPLERTGEENKELPSDRAIPKEQKIDCEGSTNDCKKNDASTELNGNRHEEKEKVGKEKQETLTKQKEKLDEKDESSKPKADGEKVVGE